MEQEQFKELCHGIADRLGWLLEWPFERENMAMLTRHDNAGFYISNNKWKLPATHIEVSPFYPRDHTGRVNTYAGNHFEIRIAISKGAERIAKEIKSRFLPTYYENLEKVVEYNKNKLEAYERRLHAIQSIADEFGLKPHADGSFEESQYKIYCYQGSIEGVSSIQADSDGKIRFEVAVEVGKAIEVLKVLKEK